MAAQIKFKAAFVAGGKVNGEARRLEGVSVITEGPALGHGVMIDAESLATVKTCAEEYRGGLKVKMNHYSGADAIIGSLSNFRMDMAKERGMSDPNGQLQCLRADLALLKNHPMTPLVLEMAETMPDSFGLSISFSGTIDEDEAGQKLMRCLEIYSCDIVDQPAANPTGLFSVPFDTAKQSNNQSMIIETPEYLALQAEHKNQAHELATIKADLESAMSVNRELLDKVALFEANNKEAEATIAKLTEDIATKATEHATAVADFDKKVGEKAAALLAQTGTTPIKLGSTFTADTAAVYEEFKAADPLKARAMLNDPNTGPLIRLESAKRNQ